MDNQELQKFLGNKELTLSETMQKIDDNTFRAAYEDYRHRSINKAQLAKRLRISRPTLDKMLKEKGLM